MYRSFEISDIHVTKISVSVFNLFIFNQKLIMIEIKKIFGRVGEFG